MDEQDPKDFEQCSQIPDVEDHFEASQELLDNPKKQYEKIDKAHQQTTIDQKIIVNKN